MTSDFLFLISHGCVVTIPDSHRTVFTFRSWLDLLGVVLAFWISILKVSKLLQNYLHRVIDITSFEKHLEFKKSVLLRCIHHFESDFINNMDHMRISGTEPSSVILSQTM